ncbi:hypothetical protein [Streptomyces thioluteus]|uniref:hypothetical protein n=1 Tax=Streptomyces thioluteus TaxID=66431 RepID=UPI0031EBD51E
MSCAPPDWWGVTTPPPSPGWAGRRWGGSSTTSRQPAGDPGRVTAPESREIARAITSLWRTGRWPEL